MSPNTPEIYCDVFDLLERYSIHYVVVSGVAVALHGHTRPVFDLDVAIGPSPDEQTRVLQVLMLAGFVPSVPLPLSLVTVMRMFDQRQREIDLFARYHIPFAELWADSVAIGVGKSTARVASLPHLLHAKRTTGRPHDLEDVAGLLRVTNQTIADRHEAASE